MRRFVKLSEFSALKRENRIGGEVPPELGIN